MKKVNDIVKKEEEKQVSITPNFTGITDSDQLPPELMKALEEKIPEWLKEYEADGTAVARWMHEYLILMEEVLRIEFGFAEPELEKLEKRIKELLPELHKMKMENTLLLRKADFLQAMENVDKNKLDFKQQRAGISLPGGKVKKLT